VRLDSAILHGPHVHNFHEPYGALDAGAGARRVADEAELLTAVGDLVADPRALAAMWAKGQAALVPLEGAVARTFAVLEPYVAQMKLSARERG
jgi:3-deoxy-D-manno-octulosonic-acid transferase